MRKYVLYVMFFISLTRPANAEWQDTLEANFDIAESFDTIDDWSPATAPNGTTTAQLPKEGGSPSKFGMWDYWSTAAPIDTPWISDHGVNSWRGKSLRMDVPYTNTPLSTPHSGPSRIYMFFGANTPDTTDPYSTSGIVTSGYRGDVYIFYMTKFNAKSFNEISPGDYAYIDYYKHHVLSTGFTAIHAVQEGSTSYGATNIHTNIATGTPYDNNLHYMLQYFCDAGWSGILPAVETRTHVNGHNINNYVANDQWFGMEIHVHRGTPGGVDGYQEMWVYDSDGTSHYMGATQNYNMMPADRDWGFTRFFIGGNSTVTFAGQDSKFYVDDLILNTSRIGPTYFSLLSGQTPSYGAPTVNAGADQTVYAATAELSGTYTIDSGLTATAIWEHGSYSGFCTLIGGVLAGTVTNLAMGSNDVTVTITDSEGQEASDTVIITRAVLPEASAGVTIQGVQWNL